MSKPQSLKNYIKSYLELALSNGKTVIPRKEIFESVDKIDPRKDYGSNRFGRDFTRKMLLDIASNLGMIYIKDNNGRNARFQK